MSKSRSKTRAISKNTRNTREPGDVQAIQRNLLALISHELRTPLAGVLQALDLVEGESEFLTLARKQAKRLEFALAHLLDISAFDSNHFRLRLKEVELLRVVKRALETAKILWPEMKVEIDGRTSAGGRYLGDAQRLERAVLLMLDAAQRSGVKRVSGVCNGKKLELSFDLSESEVEAWDEQVLAVKSALAAGFGARELSFPDAALTEKEFLSRTKEGLGGGLSLAAFVFKAHEGVLGFLRQGKRVTLAGELGSKDGKAQLRGVLESRAFDASTGISSVGLIFIHPNGSGKRGDLEAQVRAQIYRASDSVYKLENGTVAAIVGDCRKSDLELVRARLVEKLGSDVQIVSAHCPDDTVDPDELIERVAQGHQGK